MSSISPPTKNQQKNFILVHCVAAGYPKTEFLFYVVKKLSQPTLLHNIKGTYDRESQLGVPPLHSSLVWGIFKCKVFRYSVVYYIIHRFESIFSCFIWMLNWDRVAIWSQVSVIHNVELRQSFYMKPSISDTYTCTCWMWSIFVFQRSPVISMKIWHFAWHILLRMYLLCCDSSN